MKLLTGAILLIVLSQSCPAQYYYKDLVLSGQTGARWKSYKENKVKNVTLTSFERDEQPSEGFECGQEVSGDYSRITTHTRSASSSESWLIAQYSPAGLPLKIVDTSDTYNSTSEYQYDAAGRISSISNTSLETDNRVRDLEVHLWQYDNKGKPSGMLKIRNGTDTTYIRFVTDEKGNIAEERATRNKAELPTVYYYYDADSRLTDIVRFSARTQRLLPDYVFEYESGDRLASMMVVQEGGSNYQKWLYEYNDKGLKINESCYNKQKQLMGKVHYQYSSR
jgi:YD repeat-containing protein